MTEMEDYLLRLMRHLDDWSAQLEGMEAELESARAEGTPGADELLAVVTGLRQQQLATRRLLEAAQEVGAEPWEEVRRQTEEGLRSMQDAFARAMSLWAPD